MAATTVLLESVSWGAVAAGVVVALATYLVLNLLGLSVGAGTLDPGTADNPTARALSTGAAIWWILSGVIATSVGAYVAARLAGKPVPSTGAWHGLTTWALTTLLLFWLVTSTVGNVVGGALRMVTDAAGGAASVMGTVAQTGATAIGGGGPMPGAMDELLRTEGSTQAREALTALFQAATSGGDPARADAAREQAAQAIAQSRGIPLDQARTQVSQLERDFQAQRAQLGAQATQAAETTARAVSQGALWSAIAMILGAIASVVAGRAGTVEPRELLPARRTTLKRHPTPTA